MSALWRRIAVVMLGLVVAVLIAMPLARRTEADARPAVTPIALADRAEAIADATVDWWEERATNERRLPDPVLGARGDYGTVMLMAAAARRAAADGDQRRLDHALGILATQADDPSLGAFELLALAELRGWAERRLTTEPRTIGPWRRWQPSVDRLLAARSSISDNPRVRACFDEPACLTNQKLVGAAAVAALLESGLAPQSGSALLADRPGRYRDLSVLLELVAERTTSLVRSPVAALDGGGILSDPPSNPVAYHALSTLMLGRVIEALDAEGLAVPAGVRAAYGRAGRALLALQAPDGDLSYLGRGQGQVWVGAVAFAAAARLAAEGENQAARSLALDAARRSLLRLQARYVRDDGAMSLVPDAAPVPPLPGGRTVDGYASLRSYSGLAVWALDEGTRLLRRAPKGDTTAEERTDGVTIAPEAGGLAAIRQGRAWLAVAAGAGRSDDARYGPGILALRVRQGSRWRSVVPERPMLPRRLPTVALELGGEAVLPRGQVAAASQSQVLVRGTWNGTAQKFALRQRWTLNRDGVLLLSWRSPTAATVVVRAVMRGRSLEQVSGGIRDDSASWTLTVDGAVVPPTRTISRPVGSAYATNLRIVALRVPARAGQIVRLRITPQLADG